MNKDIELFDPKFVHFMWDDSLEGKVGFVSDGIDCLRTHVNANAETYQRHVSKPRDSNYSVYDDDRDLDWIFFYYDPNYVIKWAYFREGKTVQWKVNGQWWCNVPDIQEPCWFDKDSEYRIRPEEKEGSEETPTEVDIKVNDMKITINIDGQKLEFDSVEEAKLYLNKPVEGTKQTKKAYMYITGHEDKKVYINGNICYEVSERIPGIFTWGGALEIIKRLYGKDWHLPTKKELNLIYKSLKKNNTLIQDDKWYWSSSAVRDNCAWSQYFNGGIQYISNRNLNYSVRAIRTFTI